MAVQYGMKIDNINLIVEKSKTKSDGVYTFRGVTYRVEKGKVRFLAYAGDIYQGVGGFVTKIGRYSQKLDNIKQMLLRISD